MTDPSAEKELVAALRSGDEDTFARLVNDWSRPMLRVARSFVSTDSSAEEVVQDAWLAVIKGLDRFEGRSSLRTWVYRILVNTAKTRGVTEHRTLPWSTLAPEDPDPALHAALFHGAGDPHSGQWRAMPGPWRPEANVEGSALAGELRRELRVVLDKLPERQRVVITLRDLLGHTSEEVCRMLDISPGNQRVLLHRARRATRLAIAIYAEAC